MHYMKGKSGTTRKLTSIIIIISFLKVDFYITFYNFKKPITVKSIQCTVGSDFSPVNQIAHDQVKITWIRNGNMSHFIANRLDLPNRHAFDGRFHVKWRKAKKLPFKENANPIISSRMLSIVSLCNHCESILAKRNSVLGFQRKWTIVIQTSRFTRWYRNFCLIKKDSS